MFAANLRRIASKSLQQGFIAGTSARLCLRSMASGTGDTETPRRIRVYTRTGDGGESSLYDGTRRAKNDAVFGALGDVDELNASIGVAREFSSSLEDLVSQLTDIQSRLLDAGSAIATPLDGKAGEAKQARTAFPKESIDTIESWIDKMDEELPPLRNFILPSGGVSSSHLHVCRAVCRRAERSVVSLVREGQVDASVGKYLNRLSDYFFVAARFASMKDGRPEQVYKKK